jgi:hypothetical protein
MKVIIEASQQEFDSKKQALIKALQGSNFEIIKAKSQVSFRTPRTGRFKAQKEMLAHYDEKFQEMLKGIKEDIDAIIG